MADPVLVHEETQPVHVIRATGDVELMGQILSREYKGEGVVRHQFLAEGKEVPYSLGPTSTHFKVIDHAEAVAPALNAGYSLKKVIVGRGGVTTWSLLADESKEGTDPFTWDHAFWESKERRLFAGLVIRTSIKPGSGIRYMGGIFRVICTNGLIGQVLGLPGLNFTHTNFAPDTLATELFGHPTYVGNGISLPQGDFIGTSKHVKTVAAWLKSLETPPDGTVTEEEEQKIPGIIAKELHFMERLPDWYQQSLAAQFEAMCNAKDEVYGVDLVCASTNAINLDSGHEASHARIMDKLGGVLRSTAVLTSAGQGFLQS